MQRILIVAAERFELAHIPQRPGWTLVANGPGPRLAMAGMERAGSDFDALVSTGLCGALDGQLRVGDIVVATDVNGSAASRPRTGRRYFAGPLLSQDRIVGTASEKHRLYQSGAVAVDMEAAAVAERARLIGAEFFCIRAVSDVADEDFGLDLNAARDAEGRFSVRKILGQAAIRPWVGVPELVRLKRNADAASRALGEFLADCDLRSSG